MWKTKPCCCCFQNQILAHNTSARIIWSNQSLVLQSVTRSSAGKYVCAATNDLNETRSEPLHFRVKCEYFPLPPSLPPLCSPLARHGNHFKPIHLGAALYFNRADLIEDFSSLPVLGNEASRVSSVFDQTFQFTTVFSSVLLNVPGQISPPPHSRPPISVPTLNISTVLSFS